MTDEQYEAWKRRNLYGGNSSSSVSSKKTLKTESKRVAVDGTDTAYKICIFRRVEENYRVIKKNIFTGKKTNVEGSGFKVFAPWYSTKEVIISSKNIDYPKKKFMTFSGVRNGETFTGISMEVDAGITVQIEDLKKYETASQNVEQELFVLFEDILRVFVAKHTPEELMNNKFNIKDVDPRDPTAATEEEGEARLDKFAKRYGLRVSQIYFKSIDLPVTLKDDYEKTKIQEIENKRKEAEAETNITVKRLETQARVNAYSELVENLHKLGLSVEQIVDLINTENLANGKANVFFSKGSNSIDPNIVASIVAGMKQVNNNINSNEEEKPKSR